MTPPPAPSGGPARLARWLPLVGWVAGSDRRSLRDDAVAGLTVAAMLVPQSMAYAALAGMPPVTGLYAATVPVVVYALLGTSAQLAFGPVAIVALLTASTLAPIADGDPGTYVALAGMLAVLVGAIQLGLGLLRAGRLTSVLSHPVVSGFTSAAAIVIATSQLGSLLGIDVGRPDGWLDRLGTLVAGLPHLHAPTAFVGAVAVVALLAGRRLRRRVPVALLVVAAATAAVPVLGLDAAGVATIGEVPRGLPGPTLPAAPSAAIAALLPGAAVIALVAYLEGLSVARAVAIRTRDRVDPDRELVASGAANLAAGVIQAFPVAGGFSRTAVNHAAGARTPLAGVAAALGVLLALLVFAPLVTTLPEAVLAAVVVVAVTALVDVRGAIHVARIEPTDGVALAVTFLATLLVGVEEGIAIGIVAALALTWWRSGPPWHGRVRVPEPGVVAVDGPLVSSTSVRLLDAVDGVLAAAPGDAIVLDLSGVPVADATGVQGLVAVDAACAGAGVTLHLAGAGPGIVVPLERGHLAARFAGRGHPDVPAALRAVSAHSAR